MLEIVKINDIESQLNNVVDSEEKLISLRPNMKDFEDAAPWAKFIRRAKEKNIKMIFHPCRKISARSKADTEFSYAVAECGVECLWSELR